MTRFDTKFTLALLASTALAGPLGATGAAAQALPTGGSVRYGNVTIGQSGNAMAIGQSTATAIVNWQGFSIGQGNRVDVTQPGASSTLLNRVTGSAPSSIAGQLNANGQVFLVNPNGIAITPTGTVKAGGGFVASTLDVSDRDFRNGRYRLKGNGSSAAVSNEGAIEVGSGGYAALIGGRVDNSGLISVPMGKVGLGAGERATLDVSGDGFLQVTVPSRQEGDGALVSNSGRIRANGGRVEMRAASLRDAARETINMSGVVEARSVGGRSGAIVLGGGDGGRVTVSGKLDASAPTRRRSTAALGMARGGSITITGRDIALKGATLDASGPAGGGTVRVGGDYQGGGTLQHAATTSVDTGTVIRADATVNGNGGSVVLWSDQQTSFAGTISAKGGPQGGNGGDAEVSGKVLLAYSGLTDLSAAKGAFGTLLLDPYNVTISTDPDSPTNTVGPGTLVTPIGTQTGTQFTPNANDSNINASTLLSALATANVNVTTGTGGAQQGNITVTAPLSWTAPTNLALQAAGNIFINAAINGGGSVGLQSNLATTISAPITLARGGIGIATGGNLAINGNLTTAGGIFLSAGATGTGAQVTATGNIATAGEFRLNRGNFLQNAAALPGFSAGPFTIIPGTATFRRVQGGDGSTGNPFQIVDVYGLQGIATSSTFLSASYALANNIDASGTASWNNGAGFVPIAQQVGFTGSLDGRGNTINGLIINRPTENGVGLFGTMGGTIRDVRLTNATVAGSTPVGALASTVSTGASITGSSVSGNVTGGTAVGGLVGSNSGTISGSTSSAAVSGTSNDVGGLAGDNMGGTITGSSASGAVSGPAFHVGGLVGHNYSGTITNSFATGNASTTSSTGGAGGLVGENDATITLSYATGNASAPTAAGGLVGTNSGGSVSQSYATGTATGTGSGATGTGGLIGSGSGGSVTDSFSTGAASGGTGVGGLIGTQSGGTISTSYTFGRVSGSSGTGGLIGKAASSPTVNNSFFDSQATGQSASAGGTGQTTAQLQAGLPSGFSSSVYGTGVSGAQSYPFLLALPIPASILNSTTQPAPATPTAPAVNNADIASSTISPTLSRQLPFTFASVNSTPAVIDLTLGGGGGPTLGVTQADVAAGAGSATRQSASQTLTFVQRASSDLQRRIAACDGRAGAAYKDCVGGALQQYANDLDSQILRLPPPLRAVTAVIREAARRVQTVATVAEARTIVRAAVTEVRRAIALLRADEPAVARLQVRQGNVIASALQSVDTKLARAVGL